MLLLVLGASGQVSVYKCFYSPGSNGFAVIEYFCRTDIKVTRQLITEELIFWRMGSELCDINTVNLSFVLTFVMDYNTQIVFDNVNQRCTTFLLLLAALRLFLWITAGVLFFCTAVLLPHTETSLLPNVCFAVFLLSILMRQTVFVNAWSP